VGNRQGQLPLDRLAEPDLALWQVLALDGDDELPVLILVAAGPLSDEVLRSNLVLLEAAGQDADLANAHARSFYRAEDGGSGPGDGVVEDAPQEADGLLGRLLGGLSGGLAGFLRRLVLDVFRPPRRRILEGPPVGLGLAGDGGQVDAFLGVRLSGVGHVSFGDGLVFGVSGVSVGGLCV